MLTFESLFHLRQRKGGGGWAAPVERETRNVWKRGKQDDGEKARCKNKLRNCKENIIYQQKKIMRETTTYVILINMEDR